MSQSPSPLPLRSLFCEAYHWLWLCRNRKKHPPSSDIWDFRRTWLKKAIRVLNQTFNDLKLEKHPEKTVSPPKPSGFMSKSRVTQG